MLHEKARVHITGLANDELADYIRGGTDLYQEEALEFAKQEWTRRNLPPVEIPEREAVAPHRSQIVPIGIMDENSPDQTSEPLPQANDTGLSEPLVSQATGFQVPENLLLGTGMLTMYFA